MVRFLARPTPSAAALVAIVLIGFIVRVVVARLLPAIHHPDEIFQTLEQAHRLVFGFGLVPWEFEQGVRSWIFPGFLAGLLWVARAFSDHAEASLLLVSMTLSALALVPVVVGFRWGLHDSGLPGAILTGTLGALWFELLYFAHRPLNEVVAAHVLIGGVFLALPEPDRAPRWRGAVAGLLLGLTVALRVQLAPAVALAVVWSWIAAPRLRRPLGTGVLLTLLAAGALDWLTWSYPFQSMWRYVAINLVEGRSREFGTAPWFYYLRLAAAYWAGAIVPIVVLAGVGATRRPIVAALVAAIVVPHMLVAHKEYRFIYPAIPLVIILVGLGTAHLLATMRPRAGLGLPTLTALAIIAWSITNLALGGSGDFRPHWIQDRGMVLAFAALRDARDVCGVGMREPWWHSGGYALLQHRVPIHDRLTRSEDVESMGHRANYVIAPAAAPPPAPYHLTHCWDGGGTCLYKRPGPCAR